MGEVASRDDLSDLLAAVARRAPAITHATLTVGSMADYAALALLLQEMRGLQHLALEWVDARRTHLPPAVTFQLAQLQSLHLEWAASLPDTLGDLQSLTSLTVHLDEGARPTLPSSITALRLLRRFEITAPDTFSPAAGIPFLCHANCARVRGLGRLAALPALEVVTLDCASFTSLGWVAGLMQVTTLSLPAIRRFDEAAEHIAPLIPFSAQRLEEALRPLTQLVSLDIGSNLLREVPPCVPHLTRLRSLDVRNNREMRALPEGAYQASLTHLCIDDSPGWDPSRLLPVLLGMPRLQFLEASRTPLQQQHFVRLAQGLPSLHKLRVADEQCGAGGLLGLRQRLPHLIIGTQFMGLPGQAGSEDLSR